MAKNPGPDLATQIKNAIAAATSGAAGNAKQASPIGVPQGYTSPAKPTGTAGDIAAYYGAPPPVPAKYFDGMQTGQGVPGFPQSTADIARLQSALVSAGLLDKGSYAPGQWDTLSSKAYTEILAEANLNGTDWQGALTNRLTAVAKGDLLTQAGKTRAPLVRKVTNPDDIAKVANNVSQTLHATYLTPDELAKFTASYQQQEADYQTQAYAASGFNPLTGQQYTSGLATGSTPTTLTAPPTSTGLEQELESQIRTQHPEQFQANTFTDRLGEILAGLKGPASSNATQVGPM